MYNDSIHINKYLKMTIYIAATSTIISFMAYKTKDI